MPFSSGSHPVRGAGIGGGGVGGDDGTSAMVFRSGEVWSESHLRTFTVPVKDDGRGGERVSVVLVGTLMIWESVPGVPWSSAVSVLTSTHCPMVHPRTSSRAGAPRVSVAPPLLTSALERIEPLSRLHLNTTVSVVGSP